MKWIEKAQEIYENVPRLYFLRFKPQKIESGLDLVLKLAQNCKIWFLAKIYCLIEIEMTYGREEYLSSLPFTLSVKMSFLLP